MPITGHFSSKIEARKASSIISNSEGTLWGYSVLTRRLRGGEDRGSMLKSRLGPPVVNIQFHVLCSRGASPFKTPKTNESTASIAGRKPTSWTSRSPEAHLYKLTQQ
eukprot:scaffold43337_cov42-Cyclotella_meneghiniana.AAC.2